MIHLWDAARSWLWIHPWWHATILFGFPVAISTILGLWGLHHSHEANRLGTENNRLNGEANVLRKDAIRIGEEQKTSVAKIADLQGERNKLQTELNELQAKRNESLGQIAIGVKREPTIAEKNAAKLRKYIGERAAVINKDGSQWDSMGAVIGEVNDDNILQLFIPAGYSSSRATGTCIQCDQLQLLEVKQGSCPVRITILERFGPTIDYGEAKSWAERHGPANAARPRGTNVKNVTYRKPTIAEKRAICVYAPTAGNPDYSLVTFDNMQETAVYYCGKKEVERKFAVLQLEWYDEGYQYDGGNGGGGTDKLFLFTRP
jgi:hypothetical protein